MSLQKLLRILHCFAPSVITRRICADIVKSLGCISHREEPGLEEVPFQCRLSAVAIENTQHLFHGIEDTPYVHVATVDPMRSAQDLEESKLVQNAPPFTITKVSNPSYQVLGQTRVLPLGQICRKFGISSNLRTWYRKEFYHPQLDRWLHMPFLPLIPERHR